MALKYVQTLTLYQAGAGNIIGAITIVLTSLTDIYGNAITSMTPFGTKGYITLEPDTTNEEGATFTGITVNANGTTTLTGISTILAQSPYTETSGLVRNHAGGSKVVVTDNVAFWNTFANTQNLNTFTILPQSVATPTNAADFATKAYVDATAVAGAPNATTTVKGIVQEATQTQVLAKTAAGSTGAELYINPATLPSTLLSDYKVDTGAANAYAIAPAPVITAYVTGQIFSFKATNANTGASTLNVNSLGVKTIKKQSATDLVANDILAGQIVTVEYDGTNFQMQSQVGNTALPALAQNKFLTSTDGTTPSFGTVFDYQPFTSSGTWTKPANLTGNEMIVVQAWGGGGGGGGSLGSGSQPRVGGGGGGGSFVEAHIRASDLGATVTVTIGAGGTAGLANTDTSNGGVGGDTTFGTLITAYGGGGGGGGASTPTTGAGGGGGGVFADGNSGSSTAGAGGSPLGGAATVGSTFGGAGGGASGGTTGAPPSVYGGGGGGGGSNSLGSLGGMSIYGGGGGGGGYGNTGSGNAGGTSVSGGTGGTGGFSGTAGTVGIQPAGGGGGGGGGPSGTNMSAGGAGGKGAVRVWTFL